MADSETMTLARYAASSSCNDIPVDVKERAKQVVLDEMACAYFGRRSIAGELAARYALEVGGAGEIRILGTDFRTTAPYAALANGAAGHGEEVDGAHVVGGHPAATLVHAAVAVAERQRVTGAELLNAVVVGYDVGVRAVEACGGLYSFKNRVRMHSDFLYGLGAAAAASRLLSLDASRHCHSMALATFQLNGLCNLFAEKRHVSKSLCNGQYASTGVSAALMSSLGLEGHEDIFGSHWGVMEAWGSPAHREALTRGLGESYSIMGANFKFLNCGYPIHSAVEAGMALVSQHCIKVEEIESIYVGMPTDIMKIVDNRAMHNICLQDILSSALVRGGMNLRDSHFPEVLSDPAFQRLRPRILLCGDPDLDRDQPAGRGSIVRITTANGPTFSLRVDHPRGHSERGDVTWEALKVKWQEGLPECNVDRMIRTARGLEEVEDVRELVECFTVKG